MALSHWRILFNLRCHPWRDVPIETIFPITRTCIHWCTCHYSPFLLSSWTFKLVLIVGHLPEDINDMFGKYFTKHVVKVVPRSKNLIDDDLAVTASRFRTTMAGRRKHKVHIKTGPLYLTTPKNGRFSRMMRKSRYFWSYQMSFQTLR